MSAAQEIEICCVSCDSTTSTSKNEWVRCGAVHIWPVQKPWYTATEIEKGRSSFPYQPEAFRVSAITVVGVSCSHCGEALGGYCKSARGRDAKLFKESVIYDHTTIYLRDINSHEKVNPAFRTESQEETAQQRTKSSSPSHEIQEEIPAAEAEVRCPTQAGASLSVGSEEARPMPSRLGQQDVDIEKLSQKVGSLQDRMLALERSMMEVRKSSLGSTRIGQDMFIENFEAILAAMKHATTTNKAVEDLKSENKSLKQELRSISLSTASEAHGFGDRADLSGLPPRKRHKSCEAVGDSGITGRRDLEQGSQNNAGGSLRSNSCPDQPLEERRHITAKPEDSAVHFAIADMNDTVIDPALRSMSVLANHVLPEPDVLSSIENPSDKRQGQQPVKLEETIGAPQYDSIHEARIREYKARDALRKRKTRVKSIEKKKMDGEDKFKQEEKIRARDRMVKELMEREELLESDGDL